MLMNNNTYQKTENWLKSVFNINRELDFERENATASLARIEELETKKKEMYRVIASVTNPIYKSILHKRYVQGKKWEEISDELHYEHQHIYRLHKKAIVEVHNIRMGRR